MCVCVCVFVCVCLSDTDLGPPGALQIELSEEADQGKYECVAVNSAGTRYSAPANLYVRGNITPHTHTHTHTHTHAHTHAHTYAHAHTHTQTDRQTDTHIFPCYFVLNALSSHLLSVSRF